MEKFKLALGDAMTKAIGDREDLIEGTIEPISKSVSFKTLLNYKSIADPHEGIKFEVFDWSDYLKDCSTSEEYAGRKIELRIRRLIDEWF